jgi:hypothetical protein
MYIILTSFICSYNVEQHQVCSRRKGNKDKVPCDDIQFKDI